MKLATLSKIEEKYDSMDIIVAPGGCCCCCCCWCHCADETA